VFNNYYSQKGEEKVIKSTFLTDGIMGYLPIFAFLPFIPKKVGSTFYKRWGQLFQRAIKNDKIWQ